MDTTARVGRAFVLIVCSVVVLSAARVNQNIAAQRRTPLTFTRMYSGADGQTHAEEVDVNVSPRTDREGSDRSAPINVTALQFQRTVPGYFQDWHTVGQRQYLITLSGRREIEIGDGKRIRLEPGRVVLAEDTTGKGHVVRGVGTEDAISLIVTLAK